MYFRFGAAVLLAALVAVAGVAIEKRCLTIRRALTREHYRYEVSRDLYARQRLRTQQLGAPARLLEVIETARRDLVARRMTDPGAPRVATRPSTRTLADKPPDFGLRRAQSSRELSRAVPPETARN